MSRGPCRRTSRIVVVVALALLVAPALAGSAQAQEDTEPTVSIEDVTVAPGENATAQVTLSSVPDAGLSGFTINVIVNGSQAETVAASPGEAFTYPGVPIDERVGVNLRGVDIANVTVAGDTDVVLGEVTVHGRCSGEAELGMPIIDIDDDRQGNNTDVATENGTVTVTGDESCEGLGPKHPTATPTEAGVPGGDDQSDGTTGGSGGTFEPIVAGALVVALATLVLSRRD